MTSCKGHHAGSPVPLPTPLAGPHALAAVALLLVALALPLLGSCGRDGAADANDEDGAVGAAGTDRTAAVDLPPLADLNVLLIVIDTLGARHLGAYDPVWTGTPRLDALAAGGIRFARAFAPAPWTQPSFGSLFTGRMPSGHGVQFLFDVLPDSARTLAEFMAARGRRTAGVISHELLGAAYGFDQGFADYDESSVGDFRHVSSELVTDAALARLDALRDGRFLLFVHYFDPHYAYVPHSALQRRLDYHGPVRPGMDLADLRGMRRDLAPADVTYLRALFGEEVSFTDAQVGRLLDGLAARGLDGNTLVVLTADHGEELMEHDWIGHTVHLYDDLLHVPLIVALPGVLAPRVIEAPVSLLDLLPTLAAWSARAAPDDVPGVAPDAGPPPAAARWEGRSLLGLLEGREDGDPRRELFAEVHFRSTEETMRAGIEEGAILQAALLAGPLKLIHDLVHDRWELYDRSEDPAELVDLAPTSPDLVERARHRLGEWEVPRLDAWSARADSLAAAPPEVDPETLRRLRSLGYVR